MEFLNNPWFIGIVGGILSGLLTTVISRSIFSRRDRREYVQKTATANRDVIYAIRSGIPEGVVPSFEIVEAMIASAARKYGVETKDILSPKEVAEDLVKEVMDSSFISAKSKTEFCAQLAPLMVSPEAPKPVEVPRAMPSLALAEYRERTYTLLSMMMGLFATLITFTLAFVRDGFDSPLGVFLPTFVGTMGVVVAAYMFFLLRYFERRRQQRAGRAREREPEHPMKAPEEG
jgi:hypothetical protein